MKKKLTIEEMIVNAILNEGKKFRHSSWLYDEYIYWRNDGISVSFRDELDRLVYWDDIDMLLEGWEDKVNG